MKVTTKDGTRRYWGVSFQERREVLRKKFDGFDTDPDKAERLTQASLDRAGIAGDLDPAPDPVYKITDAHYVAVIRVGGVLWKIGTSPVLQIAARRYDEALFHLWGFKKTEKARFNFYKKGDLIPLCPPRLIQIRRDLHKLFYNAYAIDPTELDYNFLGQPNPPLK